MAGIVTPRAKKKFSKDYRTTLATGDFHPKGNQTDSSIGKGKNGKLEYCDTCSCSKPCDCDAKKKEESVKRDFLINYMAEQGYSKEEIKTVLKETSKDVEAEEEKLGKDLDGDNEKGESQAHKDKVFGKKKEASWSGASPGFPPYSHPVNSDTSEYRTHKILDREPRSMRWRDPSPTQIQYDKDKEDAMKDLDNEFPGIIESVQTIINRMAEQGYSKEDIKLVIEQLNK